MRHLNIQRVTVWVLTVCFVVLFAAGCGPSQREQSLEQQNTALTQRVAELEQQLSDAEAAPAIAQDRLYLIVEGDSLWSIAQKQLGKGDRYNEILALNPELSIEALKVGTRIKIPAK